MRPEIFNQLFTYLWIHPGWLFFVLVATWMWLAVLLELFSAINGTAIHTQEIECLLKHRGYIFVEVLTSQNEKLFAWIVLHPVLELIEVDATGQVRKVTMIETGVMFVGDNFLMHTCQPFLFACNGFGKG